MQDKLTLRRQWVQRRLHLVCCHADVVVAQCLRCGAGAGTRGPDKVVPTLGQLRQGYEPRSALATHFLWAKPRGRWQQEREWGVDSAFSPDFLRSLYGQSRVSYSLAAKTIHSDQMTATEPWRFLSRPGFQARPLRVCIAGGGASGICLAIKILDALRHGTLERIEIVIYEREDDFAGTWYVNRYPGCRCDIPR